MAQSITFPNVGAYSLNCAKLLQAEKLRHYVVNCGCALFYFSLALCFSFVNIAVSFLIFKNSEGNMSYADSLIVRSNLDSTLLYHIIFTEIILASFMFAELMIVLPLSDLRNIISNLKKDAGMMINLSIILLLLVSSLTIFCYILPSQDFFLLQCFSQIRSLGILCAMCAYVSHHSDQWKNLILFIATLLVAIGFQVSNFDTKAYLVNPVLEGVALAILFLFYFKWVWYLWNKTKENKAISSDEWNCNIFLLLGLGTWLALMICAYCISNPKPYGDYTEFDLCYLEICFTSFAVLQFLYQTRMSHKTVSKYKEELEFKRLFVRYIAHEVRTPLNTAIMGLQALVEDLQSASRENLDTVVEVKDSCNIAVEVLNELLVFDKLESGNLLLEKTTVNAVSLIKHTIRPFHMQARGLGVSLAIRIAPEDFDALSALNVYVDTNKIAQVIRNLVSNGLKFTPKGGIVEVEVGICEDEEGVVGVSRKLVKVSVKDSGAGISEDNQKLLFKNVVQFNPGKLQKGGGSGLGLYISYGITTMHDGTLSVFSAGEGHGSTFTLTLPSCGESAIDPAAAGVVALKSNRSAANISNGISSDLSYHIEENASYRSAANMSDKSNLSRRGMSKSSSRRMHVDVNVICSSTVRRQRRSAYYSYVSRSSVSSVYIGRKGSQMSRELPIGSPSNSASASSCLHVTAYRRMSESLLLNGNVVYFDGDGENFGMDSQHSCVDGEQSNLFRSTQLAMFNSEPKLTEDGGRQSPLVRHTQTAMFNLEPKLTGDAREQQSMTVRPREQKISDTWSKPEEEGKQSHSVRSTQPMRTAFDSKSDDELSILIVDDSNANRKMLCRLLRRFCKDCVQASNGQEAVEIMTKLMNGFNPVDVILMDSVMPMMNGLDATKAIRGLGYNGIIIGVTGNVTQDDIEDFLVHGADAVLPKPFDVASFELAITKLKLPRSTRLKPAPPNSQERASQLRVGVFEEKT